MQSIVREAVSLRDAQSGQRTMPSQRTIPSRPTVPGQPTVPSQPPDCPGQLPVPSATGTFAHSRRVTVRILRPFVPAVVGMSSTMRTSAGTL